MHNYRSSRESGGIGFPQDNKKINKKDRRNNDIVQGLNSNNGNNGRTQKEKSQVNNNKSNNDKLSQSIRNNNQTSSSSVKINDNNLTEDNNKNLSIKGNEFNKNDKKDIVGKKNINQNNLKPNNSKETTTQNNNKIDIIDEKNKINQNKNKSDKIDEKNKIIDYKNKEDILDDNNKNIPQSEIEKNKKKKIRNKTHGKVNKNRNNYLQNIDNNVDSTENNYNNKYTKNNNQDKQKNSDNQNQHNNIFKEREDNKVFKLTKEKLTTVRDDSHCCYSSKQKLESIEDDEDEENNIRVCGIKNLGNNCYLNSGLQIIARCEKLKEELKKLSNKTGILELLNDAINTLLHNSIYNPYEFISYFCNKNKDFIRGMQNCSQNFIRTLIRNINEEILQNERLNSEFIIKIQNLTYKPNNKKEEEEYKKFIEGNDLFPQSRAMSIFSGITKFHSYGKCTKKNCYYEIDEYTFNYFIDQTIYLDSVFEESNFSKVLDLNMGETNKIIMDCPKCGKEITLSEETTIVKLPDILIFTLERYIGQTNNVVIKPDEYIDFKKYLDNSIKYKINNTKYELFAINIRFGQTTSFGHEICQIKNNGSWYEINDRSGYKRNKKHNDSSYGLFYKKIE